jgi:AraC-like DNA-binding protein
MFQFMGTLLLFLKGRTHRLQHAVFWLMLYLLGISAFEFYLFFISNPFGVQWRPVTNMLQLTSVPLFLMLIYTVTHDHSMPWGWVTVNALPYVVAIAVYLLTDSRAVYYGLMLFAGAHTVFILVYGFVAVRLYTKALCTYFSSDSRYSVNWLRYVLVLYVMLAVVWAIATAYDSRPLTIAYNLLCVVIFALLCYFVYRQDSMLEAMSTLQAEDEGGPMTDPSLEDGEEGSDGDGGQPAYFFADRFETVFRKGKIYLNATLTLNDLARELGTNRTYLSNYLNQQLHTTFYEYVNEWRVRRAKELLRSTDQLLEDVALQSGFNSMSSFRRYFTAHTGMSPLEYRKRKHDEEEG